LSAKPNNQPVSIGFYLRSVFPITFLLFFNPGPSGAQTTADSLITTGKIKIEAGNLAEARKDFVQILAFEPFNNPAINGLVTILYLEGNSREAAREIEKAIEKDPQYADFYFTRGMIGNQRKNYRQAVEDFTRALSLTLQSSSRSRIYLNRGISRLNMNDYQTAAEDFTLSIEYNAQNTAAYNYRGLINYRNNSFGTAIADFDAIINLDPDNAVAQYNRAMAYLRSGDSRNACADFHSACKMGNRNACQMIIMECQ
jgi:tetratricopeptide (TPR) repeat protein